MWTLLAVAALADPPAPEDQDRLLQVPLGRSLVVTLPRAPLAVAVTDPAVATVGRSGRRRCCRSRARSSARPTS